MNFTCNHRRHVKETCKKEEGEKEVSENNGYLITREKKGNCQNIQ
jgi:hypothetical protein